MAHITDIEHFNGIINITNTGDESVKEKLCWFINRYEPDFFTRLLGYSLYKAFAADIFNENPEQRWIDLKDGVEYTGFDGYTKKWRGIVETLVDPAVGDECLPASEGLYNSLPAHYIYYHYVRSIATQTAGIGEVISKAENAYVVSPVQKQVHAWNAMSDWIDELVSYLNAKVADYPEWNEHNWIKSLNFFAPINTYAI